MQFAQNIPCKVWKADARENGINHHVLQTLIIIMKSAAAAAADEDVSGGNDTPVADVARAVVALSPA